MSKEAKKHSIISGTLITVAMRWSDRLIGLVSTLILARLLMPEDFGVVAMASIVIGLATVLFDMGVNIALIQNKQATQAHYDSAWTLRLLQSFAVALLLILLSPLAASYFNDVRVEPVIRLLALSLLIGGFENIGIIAFQKNMQFGAEFRFLFSKRVAGFVVTITLAVIWQSYWALVFGTLVGRTVGVFLSYTMHVMRPSISSSKMREIFSVSQWMLLNSIGSYLNGNLHKLLIGRWFSSSTMGTYTLADEIAAMPTGEILAPLNRVLFPAFAEVKEDLNKLKELFLLAQSIQVLIAIPAAVGLALVAEEAVAVLLGEKWATVAPFIEVLALIGVTNSIGTSSGYILLVLGQFKAKVLSNWAQAILFIVLAVFMMGGDSDVLDIAYLRLFIAVASVVLLFWLVTLALPVVAIWELVRSIIRPILGALVMGLVVMSITTSVMPLWLLLAFKVFMGALSYMVTIILFWFLSGKQDGAESYLIQKIFFLKERFIDTLGKRKVLEDK